METRFITTFKFFPNKTNVWGQKIFPSIIIIYMYILSIVTVIESVQILYMEKKSTMHEYKLVRKEILKDCSSKKMKELEFQDLEALLNEYASKDWRLLTEFTDLNGGSELPGYYVFVFEREIIEAC